ncbi:MAG: DEAD/DEAH box helicase [bacterium]|nr:DEAD/DEAH box helicase [bacterium]
MTKQQKQKPNKIALRRYQVDAKKSVYKALDAGSNPVVVIPTGGGKGVIIASILRDMIRKKRRILMLTHVKELIEQTYRHLRKFDRSLERYIGVYSAGLGVKMKRMVTLAGIQSVYRKSALFKSTEYVLVDECHTIPPDGFGRYQTMIGMLRRNNPELRVIGFTATPYRTDSGMIVGEDRMFDTISYQATIEELTAAGWLPPLEVVESEFEPDLTDIKIIAGEFHLNDLDERMSMPVLSRITTKDMIVKTLDKKSVLVFATGIKHARQLNQMLYGYGVRTSAVFGHTDTRERRDAVREFRRGTLKYLVSYGVFTTGFDAPNIDAVAVFRPTNSPGLNYQIQGRALHAADKTNPVLVLDYGGNVERHGSITEPNYGKFAERERQIKRKCIRCWVLLPPKTQECPYCGESVGGQTTEENEVPDQHGAEDFEAEAD